MKSLFIGECIKEIISAVTSRVGTMGLTIYERCDLGQRKMSLVCINQCLLVGYTAYTAQHPYTVKRHEEEPRFFEV